ncbi:MAG: hypothetical protein QM627_12910 [Luteolibacter sp.]
MAGEQVIPRVGGPQIERITRGMSRTKIDAEINGQPHKMEILGRKLTQFNHDDGSRAWTPYLSDNKVKVTPGVMYNGDILGGGLNQVSNWTVNKANYIILEGTISDGTITLALVASSSPGDAVTFTSESWEQTKFRLSLGEVAGNKIVNKWSSGHMVLMMSNIDGRMAVYPSAGSSVG